MTFEKNGICVWIALNCMCVTMSEFSSRFSGKMAAFGLGLSCPLIPPLQIGQKRDECPVSDASLTRTPTDPTAAPAVSRAVVAGGVSAWLNENTASCSAICNQSRWLQGSFSQRVPAGLEKECSVPHQTLCQTTSLCFLRTPGWKLISFTCSVCVRRAALSSHFHAFRPTFKLGSFCLTFSSLTAHGISLN